MGIMLILIGTPMTTIRNAAEVKVLPLFASRADK